MIAATDLAALHQISIWDSVILAAAADAGCRLLLSEDMQDGFTWNGVTIANPFASSLHPLLAAMTQKYELASILRSPVPSKTTGAFRRNGASEREIMKQICHKSIPLVHRFARADQQDGQAAAGKLGNKGQGRSRAGCAKNKSG